MTVKIKPRVLIADDEPHVRLLLRKVMASMNTEIIGEAKDGKEAVLEFRDKKPDLMLLDVNMPLKLGEDALKEIMADFPDAFIIMMTSVSDKETINRCIDLGAAHYIRKDTPIPEMKKMIKEAWDNFKKRI